MSAGTLVARGATEQALAADSVGACVSSNFESKIEWNRSPLKRNVECFSVF